MESSSWWEGTTMKKGLFNISLIEYKEAINNSNYLYFHIFTMRYMPDSQTYRNGYITSTIRK